MQFSSILYGFFYAIQFHIVWIFYAIQFHIVGFFVHFSVLAHITEE